MNGWMCGWMDGCVNACLEGQVVLPCYHLKERNFGWVSRLAGKKTEKTGSIQGIDWTTLTGLGIEVTRSEPLAVNGN